LGQVDLKYYFDFIKIQKEGWAAGDFGYFNLFGRIFLKKRELLQKRIISTIFKEDRYVIPCLAGNISCIMTETGDLYPCEILNKKIGNIKDSNYDFKKLWHSKEAEKIRRYIKNTRCYCTYECAITTNILFNITQLAKMFINNR
jgi:radical SAM protein with 4Fe4S-binding SPASM domain